jgi:hypothetical protein
MPSAERPRGTRGQASAMVICFLFLLILFVAVVVDVGQAVNRRVALQLVADTGAFTGATAMAVQLNAMARWNKQIQDDWVALTRATLGFGTEDLGGGLTRYPQCPVSDVAVATYDRRRLLLGAKYDTVNKAVRKAFTEAARLSFDNALDLFPGETAFDYAESDSAPDTALQRGRSERELMPSEQVPNGTAPVSPGALSNSRRHADWECIEPSPAPHIESRSADFDVWFRKVPGTPVQYFAFRASAPPTRGLMFDEVLGPNAMPVMKAAAVAKPVGGSIEKGEPEYLAKMVDVVNAMSNRSGEIQDSQFGKSRKVLH